VFAGAAREAVFSNPDVIKFVNANFIPVALKAALINRPPNDDEGLFYREISRSKPAPQYPDAKKPVAAEVYQKFPSQKRQDVEDSGRDLPALDRHPEGKHCPAEPPLRKGTVAVRLLGRALDKDGKPVTNSVRQENYIEDRFNIEVESQEKLARVFAAAGNGPVKLPQEVMRQWVKQAYLGVLDVQPLDNPVGSKGELKKCDFEATKIGTNEGLMLWRVEGESEAFIDKMANGGPGDMHEVKLKWHGFIEMDDNRMTRLVLSARGKEKLKFNSSRGQNENEVALLPGGHRIVMDCGVRFGILGEPVSPDKVSAKAPDTPQPGVPEEARRQIIEALGPPFLVFRDKVQEELQLSDEQKKKLEKRLPDIIQDAMQFFQKLSDKTPEEREKEHHSYVEKAQEKLTAFLEGALKEEQFKRLRQVMLQREGLLALRHPEIMKELEITNEQREKFYEAVLAMQKKLEPLIEESQKDGKPEEIRPKMMKIRKEHEDRIEALLSDAQKRQWKEMLGKPLNLDE
jgi:hypothetical protein